MFVYNYIIFYMLEEFLLFYRNIYIIFSLINFNRILEKVYIIEVDVVF